MRERRRPRPLGLQRSSLLAVLGLWLLGGAVIAAAGFQRWAPTEKLFLDPAYLSDQPWYTGLVSEIGVFAWTVGLVAACAGAWVALQTGRPSAGRFLGAAAATTLVLLADDLLQLHADLLPSLGVAKRAAQLVVVLPVLAWSVRYRADIVRTRWAILGAAVGALAASALLDVSGAGVLSEDGAKLLGALAWSQYLVLTAVDITRSTIKAATSTAPDATEREPAQARS